jgi:hypothetical protein
MVISSPEILFMAQMENQREFLLVQKWPKKNLLR